MIKSTNPVVANALAALTARNEKYNPYGTSKDFYPGVSCELSDKDGKIRVTVRGTLGGAWGQGTYSEIAAWLKRHQSEIQAQMAAVEKAIAFARRWDGKPIDSYDA